MRAVRFESISGGSNEVLALLSRAFADIGHANGFIDIGAKAAKDTLAEIERGYAFIFVVFATDCAGGTNVGRGASIEPLRPIDFRFATGASRYCRRTRWIMGRDNTGF